MYTLVWMSLSAPFQKVNFEKRKRRGISSSLCAEEVRKKCQKKGNYQERGDRDIHPMVKKSAGTTQMSNMKGKVNILWNCHAMVYYATYIKDIYEISNRMG